MVWVWVWYGMGMDFLAWGKLEKVCMHKLAPANVL